MMKFNLRVLVCSVCLFAVTASSAFADDSAEKAKKDPLEGLKCFIMKKKDVKGKKVLDFNGGKLYLCCTSCVKRVKKTPEKYEAKANHQMVYTGQFVQKCCPVSGEKIAKDSPKLKINGVEAMFSSKENLEKVKKLKEDEQVDLIFGKKGFAKAKFELVKKKKDKKEEVKAAS